MIRIIDGDEHPTTNLNWTENGVLLDFSQDYTFSITVTNCRDPKRFITKTTNIFGYRNARPNLVIKWQPTSELSTLPVGLYTFLITATNVRDSTTHSMKDTLMIRPAT